MDDPRKLVGRIFDIQRFSLHDGPGIRTTVFLQGCPLRCLWCHNPEGLTPRPLLGFSAAQCSFCTACAGACPHGVHRLSGQCHDLDRTRCRHCAACVRSCPSHALELVGHETSAAHVIAQVLKDEAFYRNSGGGMTISGGEPMQQPPFLEALLTLAREHHLHTAVETCGHAPWEHFARLLTLVDLFLFDLKETDDQRHRRLTGVSSAPILSNLRKLHDSQATIVLRLPLVPGVNDSEDHLRAVGELTGHLPNLRAVEVMPFHPLGQSKRERFGIAAGPPEGIPAAEPQTIDRWLSTLLRYGVAAASAA